MKGMSVKQGQDEQHFCMEIDEINNIFSISNLRFTLGKYLLHFLHRCHRKHTPGMLMKWQQWWLWTRGLGAEKGE